LNITFDPINDDGTVNSKLIDNSNLGILPNSLADMYNYCYGDSSDERNHWRNEHECQTIDIMSKVLGIKDPKGYLTSGGTEGNISATWWCKRYLLSLSKARLEELRV
jgi:hypothetical protein